MLTMNDIENIETDNGCEMLDYYKSVQRAISSGSWSMQGSYGRTMMQALKDGFCMLGKSQARDAYGNIVPSRTDIVEGTWGSREFVAEAMGEEWAAAMEAL